MPLPYLRGYEPSLLDRVTSMMADNTLAPLLQTRHPCVHQVRSNKELYTFAIDIKNTYLRKSAPLAKVVYDDTISLTHHALGLHSFVSRVQGRKTKAKHEIRIASRLKQVSEAMLRAVVVHELAHLQEKEHNKAFYRLCCHMEPDYHEIELDLRLFLTLLDTGTNLFA